MNQNAILQADENFIPLSLIEIIRFIQMIIELFGKITYDIHQLLT
jgi:hypothetical protein